MTTSKVQHSTGTGSDDRPLPTDLPAVLAQPSTGDEFCAGFLEFPGRARAGAGKLDPSTPRVESACVSTR